MEPIVVTYLEMRSRDELRPARTPDGFVARRVEPPDPAFNARMYREVGATYRWTDRLDWGAWRWREEVERDDVETWAGRFGDELVGYFELERQDDGSVLLSYFGLLPAAIGRGLGGALLTRAIDRAFDMGATRVWVHTCSLDHPNAIANYQARGMRVYREVVRE